MSVREINLLQSDDVSGVHLFDEEFLRNLWRRSYFYFNLLCVGEIFGSVGTAKSQYMALLVTTGRFVLYHCM